MSETVTVYGEGGYDPTKPDGNVTKREQITVPPETVVEDTVRQRLDQALTAMKAHVERGTFTAQQRDAALLLVLRTCIGLGRLVLRRFDSAD